MKGKYDYLPSALVNFMGGIILVSVTTDWGIWSTFIHALGVIMFFGAGFQFFYMVFLYDKRYPVTETKEEVAK